MPISFTLSPNPKWYFVDNLGRPAGGGSIYVGRSLNPTQVKAVFQDPGGVNPWPLDSRNRILIDENGTQGPFYWEFDTANPNDLYFLQVFDSDNNLLWTNTNFIPSASVIGSGGGGSITTAVLTENLVINNSFWRADITTPTPTTIDTFIAPSNHAGFAPISGLNGGGLPDIRFIKSNATATETLTVVPFTYNNTPFLTGGDITPSQYLNFKCTSQGTGETFKYVQFPITTNLVNLSGFNVAISIWAQGITPSVTLQIGFLQYFGDGGGASAPVIDFVQTISPLPTWGVFPIFDTVPSVASKTRGTCQNDALYLIIGYPLNNAGEVNFTLPTFYPGSTTPGFSFQSNDKIDSIINAPRTGDIKPTVNNLAPYGWILMNDGYIGTPASLGAMPTVARANFDTFPLYDLIWNNVTDTFAPVVGGRGVNSISDFTANKPMQLTAQLGRALASKGLASAGGLTTFTLGQIFGEEKHTLIPTELPNPMTTGAGIFNAGAGATGVIIANGSVGGGSIGNALGGAGHNTIQPTTYYNMLIKL